LALSLGGELLAGHLLPTANNKNLEPGIKSDSCQAHLLRLPQCCIPIASTFRRINLEHQLSPGFPDQHRSIPASLTLTMRQNILLAALSALTVASAQNFTINPGTVKPSDRGMNC
jgi:hypothetical protein